MNARKHWLLRCFCSGENHKNHGIKGDWHKPIHLPAQWGGVSSSSRGKEVCHNIGDTLFLSSVAGTFVKKTRILYPPLVFCPLEVWALQIRGEGLNSLLNIQTQN